MKRYFECFTEEKNIKSCEFNEIYTYNMRFDTKALNKYIVNKKILTCIKCGISYADGFVPEELDEFYKSSYRVDNYKEETFNNLYEYNRRFFSQVVYFLQSFKIANKIKVLEIGAGHQGILPTLKLFQKNIEYYYIDQINNNLIDSYGGKKTAEYFYPFKTLLPKVDLIWMSHSMEHIEPSLLKKTFLHLREALNEKGKIFIEIPNDISMNYFVYPHTIFYTEKFLKIFFKSLKFDIKNLSIYENFSIDNASGKKNLKKIYSLTKLISKYIPKFIINFTKKILSKNLLIFCLINNQYNDDKRPFMRLIIEKNNLL
jgi:hypothetical protein